MVVLARMSESARAGSAAGIQNPADNFPNELARVRHFAGKPPAWRGPDAALTFATITKRRKRNVAHAGLADFQERPVLGSAEALRSIERRTARAFGTCHTTYTAQYVDRRSRARKQRGYRLSETA